MVIKQGRAAVPGGIRQQGKCRVPNAVLIQSLIQFPPQVGENFLKIP